MKSVSVVVVVLVLAGCSKDPQKEKQKFFESGQSYMKKGDYNAAILQFRNANGQDRRFVDGYYQLGQAYLANRQYREAYGSFQEASNIDPNRLDVRLALAKLQLAAREYKQSREHAEFVIAKEPKNAFAYQVLGSALAAQQDIDGARKAYEKAVEFAPKEPVLRVELGMLLANSGNPAAAESSFRAAADANPNHLPAWTFLAEFYRRQNRIPDAVQTLRTAIDRNPDESRLYLTLADLLYSQPKTEALDAVFASLRDRLRKPETALAIGDFFSARNQPDRALAEYRRAAESFPKDLDVKARLAEHYLRLRQFQEAERWNSEILSEKPKDVRAATARARILLAQGKHDEAITALRNQITQARDSAPAHFYLAEAYLTNKNSGQAKEEFQEALRLDPELLVARIGLGNLQLALGEVAPARATADAAIAKSPEAAAARLLLGNVLLRQKDYAAAREQFSIASKRAPNDPAIFVSRGISYASEQKWIEADKEFEAALKIDPRHTGALRMLASNWVTAGQPARAIARLQQHTSTYADYPHGHLILGSLYRGTKDFARAEIELARAVQLDAKLLEAHKELGGVYHDQRRFDSAIEQFEAAVKLDPRSPSLHVLLGSALYEKGDLEQARKLFEQALTLDPNSAIAANNLAATTTTLGGNLDAALSIAQRARQLAPEMVSAADTLGWIQHKKGLNEAALPLLEECVRKQPQDPTYQYHLAMILAASGRNDRARTHLETALRLKLAGDDATQARNTLAKLQ